MIVFPFPAGPSPSRGPSPGSASPLGSPPPFTSGSGSSHFLYGRWSRVKTRPQPPQLPVPQPEVTLSPIPEVNPPTRKSKSKGPYVCFQCAKEFKNGYNLRRHQATHGVRPPSHVGALSPGTSVTSASVSMIPDGSTSGPPIHMGALEDAGAATTGSNNRKRKSHSCEACGKAFRDVYHLRRHRLAHSDERPFQCPVCQQRFKRKDRMGHHLRGHQGAVHRPYACSHCPKAFSRPDHLNSHVRQVHSTERPFKCQTCEAAFATKDRLRAHAVRHEDKVPCHVCGKLLSAAYIGDHMKVHGHGPTHVCGLCNKGFTTASYLRVHSVKDHGSPHPPPGSGRSVRCRLCGVHCATAAQLRGHLQTHDASASGQQLTSGSGQLTSGSGHPTSGSGQLTSGSGQLTSGSGQLTSGSGQLTSGSGQLTSGSDVSGLDAATSGPGHCEGGGEATELG
ncbi:myc-associated zinc finger protein-like [Coturnix japonica]|nr:myc-associated zinc finger protein-like [Coturnix japonica]